MTKEEAQAVSVLINACSQAQNRGAFNLADAAAVIQAINVVGPAVDAATSTQAQAPTSELAPPVMS